MSLADGRPSTYLAAAGGGGGRREEGGGRREEGGGRREEGGGGVVIVVVAVVVVTIGQALGLRNFEPKNLMRMTWPCGLTAHMFLFVSGFARDGFFTRWGSREIWVCGTL